MVAAGKTFHNPGRQSKEKSSRSCSTFHILQIYCYYMHGPAFAWDVRKAAANRRKHGVTFEEARSAFYDEHARLIADPDHSQNEERQYRGQLP